eukprot:2333258-Rhodomonas_salina.1
MTLEAMHPASHSIAGSTPSPATPPATLPSPPHRRRSGRGCARTRRERERGRARRESQEGEPGGRARRERKRRRWGGALP